MAVYIQKSSLTDEQISKFESESKKHSFDKYISDIISVRRRLKDPRINSYVSDLSIDCNIKTHPEIIRMALFGIKSGTNIL